MPTIKKKICLLGSFGVGKTSLIRQFVHNTFEETYLSTIGVSISQKIIELNTNKAIECIIWDIEGHQKFSSVVENYYTGAAGAVLVGDLTRPESLEAMESIINGFLKINPDSRTVFCANKNDLLFPSGSMQLFSDWSKKKGLNFFETSAKTNDNVSAVFNALAGLLV